jgi:hypothetical protein
LSVDPLFDEKRQDHTPEHGAHSSDLDNDFFSADRGALKGKRKRAGRRTIFFRIRENINHGVLPICQQAFPMGRVRYCESVERIPVYLWIKGEASLPEARGARCKAGQDQLIE